MTFTTTIEWDYKGESREVEVQVEYTYFKACKGARDAYGAPIEPDDPESVEIESVMMHSPTFHDRNAMEDIQSSLGKGDLDALELQCLEDVHDRHQQALEDKADMERDDV